MKIPFLNSIISFLIRSGVATPEKWLIDWVNGGVESNAGVQVSENSALNFSAVFRCVNLLSNTVGMLPCKVYKWLSEGKEVAYNHNLYTLLHDLPNPYTTAFRFRQTLMGHLLTWGNAYAWITYKGDGNIDSLWILRPDRMELKVGGQNLVEYWYNFGGKNKRQLQSWEVLHIPGFGYDGVKGYSIIEHARESIGLGLATEQFGSRYFGKGLHPGMIIEHPGQLSPKAHENLKTDIKEKYQGLGKSHEFMLLEEGMKANDVGMPMEDAQFLETRKFQIADIARWYGVPPHLVGDLEKATFSNIEQQSIEFVVYCLQPWLTLWEQEQGRQLLGNSERKRYFIGFVIEGLLRGDFATRQSGYSIGRQWGWYSADDIRELENLNPLPDGQGKSYLIPLNMIPADQKEKPVKLLPPSNMPQPQETKSLVASYHRLFKDAFERIIRREVNAGRRTVKKGLKEFNLWIDEFYKDIPEHIERNLLPVLTSYLETTHELTPDTERFIKEYLSDFTKEYIDSAREQLIIKLKEKKPIEEVFERWNNERAEQMTVGLLSKFEFTEVEEDA